MDEWESKKVNYCHWKSIDHLKEAYQGITDLDILVESNQMNLAEMIIMVL